MHYPKLSDEKRNAMLAPRAGRVRVVLDTDTYNEVDDQFALAQMALSPDRMKVEAIHAAPFHNDRSTGPGDGMKKSYEEILRLLELLRINPEGLAFEGATSYMSRHDQPVNSPSVDNLVRLAMDGPDDEPLVVMAIGAITNVASAIASEPRIVERMVIVWLGGNEQHWHTAQEFNLGQDVVAAQIVFDCGVPLVHIPCQKVTTHLLTTLPELEHYLKGKSPLASYLYEIVEGYGGGYGWSKVIWDVAAPSWVIDPSWVPTRLVASPILTDEVTWKLDPTRHLIREAIGVDRDAIFRDVFQKVTAFK